MGVDRKLVGIDLDGDELRAEMSEYWHVHKDGKKVGHMTDAVWSPGLKQNIGYVWVPIGLAEPGNRSTSSPSTAPLTGTTAAIPFVDPRKEVPPGS